MTTDCKQIPEIQNYIDLVRSGTIEVCEPQLLLCKHIEKCFENENLIVDKIQLTKYLSLQKYFPFKLFDWEVFCFTLHNCVYSSPGILRWPDLFILVGRGAGKNGYLSFEDFCLLSEYNNIKDYDIDICANAEDQAKTSFDDVWNVMEANENKLKSYFHWTREIITGLKTGSKLKFRTSNSKTKDGGRPGKVDFDEYHQYEDYKSIQVFKTGLGKKANPRTTITTTNGDVRGGPLDRTIATAEQILKGAVPDNGMIPFMCRLDDEKEVDDYKMWDKANPSLRYFSELLRTMQKEYIDFKEDPISNSSFMTKRMNLPKGNQDVEITPWENVLATNQEMPNLEGCTCVGGIDYAKTSDFVSAGILFRYNEKYCFITHTWVCENCADLGRIKAPLREWGKEGFLTFVSGPEIPPDIPAQWLSDMGQIYNITGLSIDNYRYTLLTKALRDVGFSVDKNEANNVKLIRPSDQMKVAPTINSLFVSHNLIIGDNPLMRWYINNTCAITSQAGNTTFGKIEGKSRKTDGFMAFVAAMCNSIDLPDSGSTESFDFGKTYTY